MEEWQKKLHDSNKEMQEDLRSYPDPLPPNQDAIKAKEFDDLVEWLYAGFGGMFGNQSVSPEQDAWELIQERLKPHFDAYQNAVNERMKE